jgi:membrane-associated phospholipid phosphatase
MTATQKRVVRVLLASAVFGALTLALRGTREGFNVPSLHAVVLDEWAVRLRLRIGLTIRASELTCSMAVWATRVGFVAAVGALLATGRRIQAMLLVLVALTAWSLTDYALKPLIDRRSVAAGSTVPGQPVFPSGQSTVVGVLAVATLAPAPRKTRALVGSAVLPIIGVVTVVVSSAGLIYSGCHYATDVVAGLCVGVVLADLALLTAHEFARSPSGRRFWADS